MDSSGGPLHRRHALVVLAGCVGALLIAACSSSQPHSTAAPPHGGSVAAAPQPSLGTPVAGVGTAPAKLPKPPNRSGVSSLGRTKGGRVTSVRSGSLPRSGAFNPAHPSEPTGLNAQSVAALVSALPKPDAGSGPSLTFGAPIYLGSSILGDLGSAVWNISHRDADGKMRNWGSGLYVSSTPSNALAVMKDSPAVAHYCPRGATNLSGFSKVGTVTVAVVCPDVNAPGQWWTVFQRADRLTYLVIATSDSSRAETVATGAAVFRALTQMSPRINIKLAVFKPAG